jgi:hypothetical protein
MLRLSFQPGVDTTRSRTTMRGGFTESNLVRAREGLYEKHLGWHRIAPNPLSGVARGIHFWTDLSGVDWLAVGTNTSLYALQMTPYPMVQSNITPAGWQGGAADAVLAQPNTPLIWSLDNFGQNLLGWPSGGGMYVWTPSVPPILPTLQTTAPSSNHGGFVAMPQQIAVGLGCTPFTGGNADPMLVRWSDIQDYTDWSPTVSNQAGSFRLSRGSRIVGGISTSLGQFLWTDLDMWAMQYQGFPLVYGFNMIGPNSGLMGRNAVVNVGNMIAWASDHGFFAFSGGAPSPIPCTVWDTFFANINEQQQSKVVAGSDQHHNEIYWFYPSVNGGSGEIDSYVKWNYVENLWDFGPATPGAPNLMARTCWTDQNRPGGPVNVDLNNLIQQQDRGCDADGRTMTGVKLTSGFLDIVDGEEFAFVDMLLPDFQWHQSTSPNPSLQMNVLFRSWSGDQPTISQLGPFTITPSTEYVTCRSRGREIAVQIICNTPGTWFRMGTIRIRQSRDGKI